MSDLEPLGVDVWYVVHYIRRERPEKYFHTKRVGNAERYFAHERENVAKNEGIIEVFNSEEDYQEAITLERCK